MKKNYAQQEFEYDSYCFSRGEALLTCMYIVFLVCFLAVLFYRSVFAVLFLSPVGYRIWKKEKHKKIQKRKKELGLQFKDCIQSVSANLRAGYSVENAFRESYSEISLLYGKDSYMAAELTRLTQGLANNISLECLLLSLGERSGVTDIREFGQIFSIAKRNGGSMTDILMRTSKVIGKKMEIDKEIQVLISAKQMEQRIMNIVPFVIILYISITSPGFFDVLYHNLMGVTVMTICLAVYFAAYELSSKIVDIRVD